jgi:hypothetical protein
MNQTTVGSNSSIHNRHKITEKLLEWPKMCHTCSDSQIQRNFVGFELIDLRLILEKKIIEKVYKLRFRGSEVSYDDAKQPIHDTAYIMIL